MAEPFIERPLERPGIVGRLLKRGTPQNAAIAIECVLAAADSVTSALQDEVDEALVTHAPRGGTKVADGSRHGRATRTVRRVGRGGRRLCAGANFTGLQKVEDAMVAYGKV